MKKLNISHIYKSCNNYCNTDYAWQIKSISTEHDDNLITNYSMCALNSVAPIANSS